YFVGRSDQLAQLDQVLQRRAAGELIPAVCISGPPGIGKTALAVRWSHRAVSHFPDGVLFADLHGFSAQPWAADWSEVMLGFLRALGVTQDLPASPDQASALLRSALHGTRTLIVCDNIASAEQARQFLPGSPGCLLLVTSRDSMASLAVREGAVRMTVDRFSPAETLELLGMVVGPERLAAERDSAAELGRRCDYLPLAVRITAERLATDTRLTMARLAGELSSREGVLDALATAGNTVAVRTVFSWSYELLPAASARLFRLLGLHPGTAFEDGAAAALADLSPPRMRPLLDSLADVYLVERHGGQQHRMHDLLHAYAAELALTEPEADRRAAIRRLLCWYLHSTARAVRTLMPAGMHPRLDPAPPDLDLPSFTSRSAASAWCDRNQDNIVAAISLAKVFDPYVAKTLPDVLWDYYHRHKRPDSAVRPDAVDPASALAPEPARATAATRPAGFDTERRRWVSELPGAGDGSGSVRPTPPLAGELSVNRSDLTRVSTDFGRISPRYPLGVFKPTTTEDIAALVSFARSCGLATVPRGHGYSTEGQSLAPGGIVIDMTGFDTIHAVETDDAGAGDAGAAGAGTAGAGTARAGTVNVGAGARWSDVLRATLPRGLTPPVLTNYLEVSVGGTLSSAGISGASHHCGTQTDTVLGLEVVTPEGDIRFCSPEQETELFDAVRSGYGQHGVITRAVLGLVPAPARVRRYFLGYSDLPTFLADQQRLALEGRFSYLEGQPQYDSARWRWRYVLEAGCYFTPPEEPDDQALLRDLRWTRGTEEVTTSSFDEFARRLAPTEALLRSLGTWQHHPHPWATVLVPSERTAEVVAATLDELTSSGLGSGGAISLYPLCMDKLRTPGFPRVPGRVAFLFCILRTAPRDDPPTLGRMIDGNEELYRRVAR
ncbi:MAG: FAD-binding protein, partial [Nocardiopsaceae bacterium]|nr:FAD-binding protein [Nocardiopsaceae bacterium]